MTTEIKLIQAPVIQHSLVEIGKTVTSRIFELNLEKLVATEETIQSLKKLRAELNKEFDLYEAQRKAIKEAVANPYVEFENVYKTEISEKYKKAVETLKDKIASVEEKVKAGKKTNIIRYFNELCASENIDFLKFENTGFEINLSTSEKQYKEKCNEFVQRIADDILLIQAQEYSAEIMTEYKFTLNVSKAITTVVNRKEAEKLERERIRQAEIARRTSKLREIPVIFHDITKTYHPVFDESMFITLADVENLSKNEFQKRFVQLEAAAKQATIEQAQQQSMTFEKPIAEPLPAPAETKSEPASAVEKPVAEIFTAIFEAVGTMAQLIALGEYMKSNNIQYKNI